jgi:L-rhamnose isomerase
MSTYELAHEAYAAHGVDTEKAIESLSDVAISLNCWQGDDVGGFEKPGATLQGGGILATGSYPGKARTIAELRSDLEAALKQIPGNHRLNLHASYGEFGGKNVERNEILIEHFQGWIDWCRTLELGIDFNPTYFSHPLAATGYTLAHADATVRRFWVEHGIACRRISAGIGKALNSPVLLNVWIPDGSKDIPADRVGPRLRLEESLDATFREKMDARFILDVVESKLFGIGSECYVVGSHEFYLGYAVKKQIFICLDSGHFHPTESVADKISSVLQFVPGLLLHVSRGVHWDSDHVALFDDPTRAMMQEVVRGGFMGRTHIGLDYFDASINRVAAWVIGARNVQKSILAALLEPIAALREAEQEGDFTGRLALMEEAKTLPLSAVWDEFCARHDSPVGTAWITDIKRYEREVLSLRG